MLRQSELEDIPGQILSTPESAETEPEYNYIHFRYDNIWTVSALVNYEIVDNGQNIKFEINDEGGFWTGHGIGCFDKTAICNDPGSVDALTSAIMRVCMTYENLTNFRKVFVKYLTISQQRMNEIKKYTDAVHEKNAWLDAYLPEIDSEHRIFVACGSSKARAAANRLKTPCIDNSFVLLDDYSVNLHEWKANRGSCIKLRNGINGNGGTWKGESVTRFDTAENIADRIWSIIKKQMQ